MCRSNNFGVPVGQAHQLVQILVLTCGATLARSLLGHVRQGN